MKTALQLLSQVSIASPCQADWNEMVGNEFARYCGECEKNVYNLSALTADDALALIREKEGKLCGRYFRREDGTVLTADCPVGVHHRIRHKRRLAVLATSLASFLMVSNGCTRFDDTNTGTPPAKQEKTEKECLMGEPVLPAGVMLPLAGGICAPNEVMGKIVEVQQRKPAPVEVLPTPREVRID